MSPPAVPRSMRRAVFVSDVHLGSKHCHAAEFAGFLEGLNCARLYLVGDIVDGWRLKARWHWPTRTRTTRRSTATGPAAATA